MITKEERSIMPQDELLRAVWLLDEFTETYQWISVSDKLPIGKDFEKEIDGEVYHRHVLAQCEDEDIPMCTAYYDTNAWFCACTNQELNVVAWMMLPESYKPD